MSDSKTITVLEPGDEHPHQPDDSPYYDVSTYLDTFDLPVRPIDEVAWS